MNAQDQLQWQAWVDGELDPATHQQLAERLKTDPEARALCDNLRSFRALLQSNEPVRSVPESPDFYWSKIRRGIEAGQATAVPSGHTRRRPLSWLAWLLPATALAMAVLLYFRTGDAPTPPSTGVGLASATPAMVGHEIEAPATGLTTLTFYSAQDSLTVVWLGKVDML